MSVEIKTVDITPELASEWLNKNTCNRPLVMSHVRTLEKKIKEGKWQPYTCDMIGFYEDGSLANGQHRLTAIKNSGITCTSTVAFGLSKELSICIDTGKRRSIADNIKINTDTTWYTNKIVNMLRLSFGDSNTTRLGYEEHLQLFHRLEDDIKWVYTAFKYLPRYFNKSEMMASVFLALKNGVDIPSLQEFLNLSKELIASNSVELAAVKYYDTLKRRHLKLIKPVTSAEAIKQCQEAIYRYTHDIDTYVSKIPTTYRYPLLNYNNYKS